MTVVVAVADGARVWMGCDTLGVNGWDQKFHVESKIVRRQVGEGECLFGIAGAGAVIEMFRYDLEIPDLDGDVDRWVYDIARSITSLCASATPPVMNEAGTGINASVILGFAGRLWSIATNEAWKRDPWTAIGSGDEYALGVLHACEHLGDLGPQDVIYLAVQAASRFDLHCGGDLHLETI